MPHRVSHPHDVPVCAGLAEWLLSGYLGLYRALSQSPTAAETGEAAASGATLNSTVRDIGVEPLPLETG